MKKRIEKLDEMLEYAVINSIPEETRRIGVWASGGIDSSALLWYLKDHGWDADGIHVYFEEGARSKLLFEGVVDHLRLRGYAHKMTLKDHFQLLPQALIHHEREMSAFPTMLLFMALKSHRYDLILHGLGLDELLGGYRQHEEARERDFVKVENRFYRELPMRVYNTERQAQALGQTIKAPFISEELRGFCQALPRKDKAFMGATKIGLREIMRGRIPRTNRVEGRFAGTKAGFHPPIRDWWFEGLNEWCYPRFNWLDMWRLRKKSLWAKIIRANERERARIVEEKANGV